ncbi:polysaccharide lyase family 7 protein [Photobacterium sp. BZF1]|uniref:polysaccharide lyase family 7 protein n=1 Tax=Photobacterium sp. BZF1 TaxID=1904457 RepID=UPI001653A8C2|nr:polysaccharide lyase family 7 protein [Photobacterium sp. BZF1]MBC7003416.1 polysaccharide lyase family 7 protein [Photobacterium sp. BZF1]
MRKTHLLLIGSIITSQFAVANSPKHNTLPFQEKITSKPASYPQFSHILSSSKLQISTPNAKPGSKNEMAKNGDFTGIVNEHFYVDGSSEALVFNMEGYKLRNELRVLENFSTAQSDTTYQLKANLQPINPITSVQNSPVGKKEITYLQVHNKGIHEDGTGYIPHPLVRITWELERNGKESHYWAVIKANALDCSSNSQHRSNAECKKAYRHIDLGPADLNRPTQFDISVGNNQLVVNVDGETKLSHDITYWQHLLSYFKAGVYNQFEGGKSEAHFYQLDYIIES